MVADGIRAPGSSSGIHVIEHMGRYPTVNMRPVRYQMGSVLSPYSLTLIPTFDITLKNGKNTQVAKVGFDTGMHGTHLQISSYLARYLGIQSIGKEGRVDATKSFQADVGRIDRIIATGYSGCALAGAKVIFYDGAPDLIGNDFIRDVGAEISYEGEYPFLKCKGPSPDTENMEVPIFPVVLIHNGKVIKTDAMFDTGWERDDIAIPQSIAKDLGLSALKTVTGRTHTGTVTLTVSQMDRLTMQDLPECHVDTANVAILPIESPIQQSIVGEGFFTRINGQLGYDQQGPFFSCSAAQGRVARPARTVIVPVEEAPVITYSVSPVPWIIGGLVTTGLLAYFMTR